LTTGIYTLSVRRWAFADMILWRLFRSVTTVWLAVGRLGQARKWRIVFCQAAPEVRKIDGVDGLREARPRDLIADWVQRSGGAMARLV